MSPSGGRSTMHRLAPEQVAVAICPHGQSSSYCFSDYVWQKYKIGEAFKLKDAKDNLVTTNIYLKPDHALSGSQDPNDEEGFFQDTSIETLQKRGVVFTTCHTAVEEQARNLVKGGFTPASMAAQDVANDILTHLIPGSVVVPSMVGAIAVMQARYKYTYVTLTY
jgi:intracellular sulfur oxidation DsrE/DsrF family protein